MYPIDQFRAAIAEIPHSVDPIIVRTKSRDFYGISPLLRQSLGGRVADIVTFPRSVREVATIVKEAVRLGIPITPRGGGTANYGQCVPLKGGIVMEMTGLSGVTRIGDGVLTALGGTLMSDVDKAARKLGWELRIHPSTRATATIAGFIAGGSGGMGSCMWGMLRDRGNITALSIMSMESEPKIIELRGRDVELVHHAYGANGIIIEVELPLVPAWHWRECIVAFPNFMGAAKFGVQLARETGILKKLISLQEWPVAELMADLRGIVPDGCSMANCMIAQQSLDAFECLVEDFGGAIVSNHAEGEGPYPAPIYEYAYGHGLRHVQRSNPKFTALQGMFPANRLIESIAAVHAHYAGQMPFRLEVFYSQGDVVAMGSHYIPYESEQQMADIVAVMQSHGVQVANNHANGVREVGIKSISDRDITFKRSMDPLNLLNPGKFDVDDDDGHVRRADHVLPTTGWLFTDLKTA